MSDDKTTAHEDWPQLRLAQIAREGRIKAAGDKMLALLVESQRFIGGDWRVRRDTLIQKINGGGMPDENTTAATVKRYAHLCVGGPLDGCFYEAHSGGFSVPVRAPERAAEQSPLHRAPQIVSVEHCHYVECTISTPEGDVAFWVPSSMSAKEMLDMLAKGYRP